MRLCECGCSGLATSRYIQGHNFRSKKPIPLCINCGNKFRLNNPEQKCCSRSCAAIVRKATGKERISLVCQTCGIGFLAFPYRLKDKFCSMRCYREAGRKRIACLLCGELFKQRKSENRKYCSWKCCKSHLVGSNAPNWKDGNSLKRERARYGHRLKKWRLDVFGRDRFQCQSCGMQKVWLHAHHIKPWASHPESRFEINNGVTLCFQCHGEIHGKNFLPRKTRRDKIQSY